jgi:hypothetical protein
MNIPSDIAEIVNPVDPRKPSKWLFFFEIWSTKEDEMA